MDAIIYSIFSIISIAESERKERNPYVSTINSNRFSLGVENDRADAKRDARTCLAGPNSQARTGTAKSYFTLFN